MNEPAIRTEEQIISLFPDRETKVCRGTVRERGNDGWMVPKMGMAVWNMSWQERRSSE